MSVTPQFPLPDPEKRRNAVTFADMGKSNACGCRSVVADRLLVSASASAPSTKGAIFKKRVGVAELHAALTTTLRMGAG